MTETQKRIKAYQDALPGLKERVAAVALLLVMSLSMLVSASFAWVTISNAPEVQGATTTVAANGNLEIALAGRYEVETDEEGKTIRTLLEPANSAVGDSSASENQTVFASNLTWGNLVNLSDPDYGLDQIVLRPASLNTAKLVTNPFRSAVYGDDGRVESGNFDEFSYCIWKPGTQTEAAHFAVTEDEFGVRAVSTVTSKYSSDLGMSPEDQAKIDLYEKNLSDASSINFTDVNNIYQNQLIKGTSPSGTTYMKDLCMIIGKFMTAKICKGDGEQWENPNMASYMNTMVDMFSIFRNAMNKELEAMAALANVQQYVYLNGNTSFDPYTPDKLRTATVTELTAKGIHLAEFESFLADLNQVEADLVVLQQMQAEATKTGSIKLKDQFPNADDPNAVSLYDIVFHLVDVDSCMVHNTSTTSVTVGSINNIDKSIFI